MPDGSPWPKISIVTPSLNQGQFIEETIRSVFLQGYPELEYIIVDGGSNDGTIGIVKKYEKWLAKWMSEPDKGQSHAINKGFNLTKGEIIAWINSDDYYLQGTLKKVAEFFRDNAETDMIFGECHAINEKYEMVKMREVPKEFDIHRLITRDCFINQPSTFFRRKVIDDVGGLCESLNYSMDYDLWIKIGLQCNVKRINDVLSCFRKHPNAKTVRKSNNPLQYHENMKIRKKYGGLKQAYEYYRHVVLDSIKSCVRANF
jgi:glycosyltransferase involved in cell wall biosynthesis